MIFVVGQDGVLISFLKKLRTDLPTIISRDYSLKSFAYGSAWINLYYPGIILHFARLKCSKTRIKCFEIYKLYRTFVIEAYICMISLIAVK